MEDSNEAQTTTDSDQGKRFPRLAIAIVIATGLAVWLVPDDESSAPETPIKTTMALPTPRVEPKPEDPVSTAPNAEMTSSAAPKTPPAVVTEAPPPVEAKAAPVVKTEAPPPTKTDLRPGEYARRFIASLRSSSGDAGPEAFAAAERQREAGRTEDAYLLYFFAAKQGHGEAALELGTQTDPAHFTPENGIHDQADPAQAYKWYQTALENGNAEAERRIASLFKRIEQQAATGDESARRLILQWR